MGGMIRVIIQTVTGEESTGERDNKKTIYAESC